MTARSVTREDASVRTETSGDDGIPVLLIAAANASSRRWPDEHVGSPAAHGYRAVRYDHRDTGRSTTRPFDDGPYGVADPADGPGQLPYRHLRRTAGFSWPRRS